MWCASPWLPEPPSRQPRTFQTTRAVELVLIAASLADDRLAEGSPSGTPLLYWMDVLRHARQPADEGSQLFRQKVLYLQIVDPDPARLVGCFRRFAVHLRA